MEEKIITYEDIEKANKTIKPFIISRKNKETGKTEKKGYAEVHQRVKAFRMVHPNGDIDPQLIGNENGIITFRVDVYDGNKNHLASGTASEKIDAKSFINANNAIENCETSAVGRALGFAGFGIDTSVSSAEEIKNAVDKQQQLESLPMTEEQIFMIANLDPKYKEQLRKFYKKDSLELTQLEAETAINSLKAKGVEIKTQKEVEIDRKKEEEVF